MTDPLAPELDDLRRRFDAACGDLRPDLHRFCSRMTGNPCDGEDLAQETLVHAFYRLGELRDGASLRSWLFRIAHNKCIDALRASRRYAPIEERTDLVEDRPMEDDIDRKALTERALATIALDLPPKERACLVLKDVLDFSLEEAAEITRSNVGAVKAALHRAREKLEHTARGGGRGRVEPLDPRRRAVVARYLEAFNRRDWDGVRALLTEDARLEVVDRVEGPFAESSYFTNYGGLSEPWKLVLAWVDGVEAVVQMRERDGLWTPVSVVRIAVEGDRVSLVRDYVHVSYLLDGCVVTEGDAP